VRREPSTESRCALAHAAKPESAAERCSRRADADAVVAYRQHDFVLRADQGHNHVLSATVAGGVHDRLAGDAHDVLAVGRCDGDSLGSHLDVDVEPAGELCRDLTQRLAGARGLVGGELRDRTARDRQRAPRSDRERMLGAAFLRKSIPVGGDKR